MSIPYQPVIFNFAINVHLVLEYIAFFIAFRYYLFLRKRTTDAISNTNRLSIILGAAVGALLGSRIIGYLENPVLIKNFQNALLLLNTKSIMGGLFGGLLGVEIAKKIIHEKRSSGDLFVLPLITGIFIGRIGCFLSGINEFTYGKPTNFITGMNLGDGIKRHPTALYELIFLIILFLICKVIQPRLENKSGLLFKLFMLSYFSFRFCIEFLKPNIFFILHLSSIQWLCIVCWVYYFKTLKEIIFYAYKKIHLL